MSPAIADKARQVERCWMPDPSRRMDKRSPWPQVPVRHLHLRPQQGVNLPRRHSPSSRDAKRNIMLAGKLLLALLVVLIVTWVFGRFGPGPLILGLGPMFDQLPPFFLGFCLLLVIVWLARKLMSHGKSDSARVRRATPEQILRERYVRGELNRDEIYRIAEDLRSGPPQGL